MAFARIIFWIAGVIGLVLVAPLYVIEGMYTHRYPPALTHPEFYYGFAGVTIAWQIAFLLIGSNPGRYRPIMLAAIVEKFAYCIAIFGLAVQNRIPAAISITGAFDLMLGILFVMAWLRSGKKDTDQTASQT